MKFRTKPLPKKRQDCYRLGYEDGCIALSKLLDEHPEGWNDPCMCAECMSYSDE